MVEAGRVELSMHILLTYQVPVTSPPQGVREGQVFGGRSLLPPSWLPPSCTTVLLSPLLPLQPGLNRTGSVVSKAKGKMDRKSHLRERAKITILLLLDSSC